MADGRVVYAMKKYGILPESVGENTLINVYVTDRAFWRSLWWPLRP